MKYRASQCTTCRTDARRVRPIYFQDAVTKECRNCREVKTHSEFSPSSRGKLKLAAYCKVCASVRFKPSPEEIRLRTSEYRARHPERARAAHRLHQFKRRAKIAATCDGTVDDEFLKELYSRTLCFWCKSFTERDKRTLEHVKELNDGGTHSADNIEMACSSCNSARLGRIK